MLNLFPFFSGSKKTYKEKQFAQQIFLVFGSDAMYLVFTALHWNQWLRYPGYTKSDEAQAELKLYPSACVWSLDRAQAFHCSAVESMVKTSRKVQNVMERRQNSKLIQQTVFGLWIGHKLFTVLQWNQFSFTALRYTDKFCSLSLQTHVFESDTSRQVFTEL